VPLIHFDTTPADVDKNKITPVYNEVGDLHRLLTELLQLNSPPKNWNIQELQTRKNDLFNKMQPCENSFGPLAAVHDLREFLPDQGILTVDVGAHLHLIGQKWETPAPQKLLMTNGWSAMGFALPAALSAKLCYPELPVVAIMGDGGFFMTCGELATAKRLNLNIVFVVLVDGSLSLIRIKK
jgi:acetolactate synthase-1/2/3 large subunit